MTDTFRAMCAELVDAYAWCIDAFMTAPAKEDTLIQRARTLLAEPTPQPVADGEVAELVSWLQSMRDLAGEHNPDEQRRYTRAAELLERPTPQPVAVSERLPKPEDCDELETCWQWEPDINGHHPLGLWERVHRDWVSDPDSDTTHWLPANALPTPEATNDLHR